ncbi:DUF5719 family protein [uncultured Pseudokineococcus sp.]|uniref:DUF5719 family protein n=1 Tax=uncultured Pseudokineococcus sp. TaxID=1642928 RepID=UPI00261AD85F|nr:DUF5719 family protein [uncultured Pseudokineococcus sp.]
MSPRWRGRPLSGEPGPAEGAAADATTTDETTGAVVDDDGRAADGAARRGWTPAPPSSSAASSSAAGTSAADSSTAGSAADGPSAGSPSTDRAAGAGTSAAGASSAGTSAAPRDPAAAGDVRGGPWRTPRVLAAVASGLLVLGVAGTAVAGASLRPVDGREQVPDGGVVQVGSGPGTSTLGCPGGPVAPVAPVETDSDFAVVQTPPDQRLGLLAAGAQGPVTTAPALVAGSSTTTGAEPAAAGEVQPVDGTAVGGGAAGTGGAAVLSATGADDEPAPSLSALATTATPDGDLQGLAAAACPSPTSDAWLVGGSTSAGSSSRLVLVNPGATAAEVDVELLTPDGLQQPPAGQGVVVPAGQRAELLVEGLVGGVEALAVHVTSTGGAVAPSLVVTRLEGLVPRGVEVVVPSAPPAQEQVVPGVATAGSSTAVLRLAVPGPEPAGVRWDVLADEAGAEAAGALSSEATVPASSTVDVPLGGVPAGSAGVAVTSDAPVVASVVLERLSTAAEAGPADLAVAPATAPVAPGAGLALPAADAGLTASLLLTNATDEPATAELVGVSATAEQGEPVAVQVPARSTTAVDPASLGAVAGVLVVGADVPGARAAASAGAGAERSSGLHAALVLTAPAPAGAVAVAVPSSVPAAAGSTPVLVTAPGRWP